MLFNGFNLLGQFISPNTLQYPFIETQENDLKIYGNPKLEIKKNIHVKNYLKDHRVFMMSCIAALTFGGRWKIDNKNSINTSFPIFLKLLKKLGAKIN